MARPGKTPKQSVTKSSEKFFKESLRDSFHSRESKVLSITKFHNCMDHIREKETIMSCGNISVLFINDFDKGFTPVLELEISNLEMSNKADFNDENTEVEVQLPMLTANYFNLELGEWEPLLEQFSMKADIHETVS